MAAVRLASAAACVALSLLVGCSGGLRAKFPTEDEVRGKLRKGMTADEVLATFGQPAGLQPVDLNLGGKVHYVAPPATRVKPGAGYAGFTVYFDRGKVWDWDVILLNPSYEHRLLPAGARSWPVRIVVVVLVSVGLFFGVRFARRRWSGRNEMLRAYAAREIPTRQLPPEFRFITADATLQSVIDEAGPYSRVVRLPIKNGGAESEITAFEYELPNGAALLVMPEPPFQPESRLRAVVYRRARGDLPI